MSHPLDNYIRLFRSDAPFNHILKQYLVTSPEDPSQTLLNFEAIAPIPRNVRGKGRENEWIEENWGTDDILDSYASAHGMAISTNRLPLIPLVTKLAMVSGHDLRYYYYSDEGWVAGELIAYADGTETFAEYSSPCHTPQWLLEEIGYEPLDDHILPLDGPIPEGWGRALSPSEISTANDMFDDLDASKLLVRRSLPDNSGVPHVEQIGRLYGPTSRGWLEPVGFAQF